MLSDHLFIHFLGMQLNILNPHVRMFKGMIDAGPDQRLNVAGCFRVHVPSHGNAS